MVADTFYVLKFSEKRIVEQILRFSGVHICHNNNYRDPPGEHFYGSKQILQQNLFRGPHLGVQILRDSAI